MTVPFLARGGGGVGCGFHWDFDIGPSPVSPPLMGSFFGGGGCAGIQNRDSPANVRGREDRASGGSEEEVG